MKHRFPVAWHAEGHRGIFSERSTVIGKAEFRRSTARRVRAGLSEFGPNPSGLEIGPFQVETACLAWPRERDLQSRNGAADTENAVGAEVEGRDRSGFPEGRIRKGQIPGIVVTAGHGFRRQTGQHRR